MTSSLWSEATILIMLICRTYPDPGPLPDPEAALRLTNPWHPVGTPVRSSTPPPPRQPVIRSGGGAEPAGTPLRGIAMLVDRERVLPDDALDQLASKLLAEVRSQHPQKLLGRPIVDLGDDVGTNLLAWLLDAYDDALAADSDD